MEKILNILTDNYRKIDDKKRQRQLNIHLAIKK